MKKNDIGRTLATIAEEIRARTETIADVIEIGRLLIEAKGQAEHGEWLPWLEREFDFSDRTAENYMAAHRFAEKFETVSNLKLTLSALYFLARCDRSRWIEAVLTAAATRRVTRVDAWGIVDQIRRTEHGAETEAKTDDQRTRETEAERAAEEILNGQPPSLPPLGDDAENDLRFGLASEPTAETQDLIDAVKLLLPIYTKPLSRFVDVPYGSEQLRALQDFFGHLAAQVERTNAKAA